MQMRIFCFVIIIIVLTSTIVDGKGRGGGGRGGGSRGGSRGSSSGSSRGSSSRGSSSRGTSSTSTSNRERYNQRKSDDKSESKPSVSQPSPKVPEPTRVKPSAPEMKETGPAPSAPRLPSEHNPAYNPNYGQGPKTQPGINPAQHQPGPNTNQNPGVPPPPYPGSNTGQNLGAPPPYPGSSGRQNPGAPPPYPGPSQQRPPPYDTQPRPPPPGFKPGEPYPQQPGMGNQPYPQQPNVGNQPYPRQPGVGTQPYPQQPGMGNPSYPQQPGIGNQPYPRQPGMGNQPYPQQPGMGNQAYPRQPGVAPYPQQPGGIYGSPPSYVQHSGLPMGGTSYTKPYKKKGLLGQIFSFKKGKSNVPKAPKPPKYGSYGPNYGMPYGGGHSGMPKAMYPMMPMMMAGKRPKLSHSFGNRPSFMFLPIFLPSYHHHHYGGHYYDINHSEYRGGCRKPLKPNNSTMDCDFTTQRAACKVKCNEGYNFAENITEKENNCWHVSGVWRPSRNFPQCLPICKEKCRNSGKCKEPGGACICDSNYRGESCEQPISNCNVMKLAGENSRKISWVCQHTRKNTNCTIKCRPDFHFPEDSQPLQYQCTIDGTWTPNVIPTCISDQNTTVTTTVPTE